MTQQEARLPPTQPIETSDGLHHWMPDGPRAHRRSVECVCAPNLIMDGGRIVRVMHQRITEFDS